MSYNQLNKKSGEDIIELMDNDKYSYEKKMEKMCHLLKIMVLMCFSEIRMNPHPFLLP